ncbi:MAG: hypothetical protein L0Z47_05145 [Actinobacteria bacterium]|nr:hypothetical protein [Actinomycetota bacterium]
MQSVLGLLDNTRVLLLALTLAMTTSVVFTAETPGQPLLPVGDAAMVVRLVQGEGAILWTSLAGEVATYRVEGWPSADGDIELGGALVMERVNADAGLIELGERPMTLVFELAG